MHQSLTKDDLVAANNDIVYLLLIIMRANNNILVYFKGAFGVSSGSLEPIIDIQKLIKIAHIAKK